MSDFDERFRFLTTRQYFTQLVQDISAAKPGESVMLISMTFVPEADGVREVLNELIAAAARGVAVTLLIDAKPFLLAGTDTSVGLMPGPLFFNGEMPLKLKQRFKTIIGVLERLQDAGGHYRIINQPNRRFSNPIAGRSHLKFAVIADTVFTGGCNLDTVESADSMVRWQDHASAQWLLKLGHRIMTSGSVRLATNDLDLDFQIDSDSSLILDAGVRGQSAIFAKGIEIIDAAREFLVVSSQYFPNDMTAFHLRAAYKRGVDVRIFYNHPSKFDPPHNLLHYGVVTRARLSLPKSFFVGAQHGKYLHAKMVISERAAMVGSHNLVAIGVKLGTAEMDILSTDPEFGRRLLSSLFGQIDH
jgi:phosphatidylserine/phosphatidylglycerophosphate/cardiolipin synthase-like enzyme